MQITEEMREFLRAQARTQVRRELWKSIFIFVSTWVGFFVAIFTQGFGVMVMWNWFVHPLGVPLLKFFPALGLSLLVRFMTSKVTSSDFEALPENKKTEKLWISILGSWLFIGLVALVASAT